MKAIRGNNGANRAQSIFARVLANGNSKLTRNLARYLLTLGFSDLEQARMQDLAARNQADTLSLQEKEELFGYVKAGHMLALLQSTARRLLKRKKAV